MRTRLVVLPLIAVTILGTGGYFLSRGFSAKGEPTRAEAFIARWVRHLAIPMGARSLVNPVKFDHEVLSRAMEHFADHCALCHGDDGRGMTLIGRGLYPKAPDMTQPDTQQ